METVRCNFCQSNEYKSIVTQTDILHNSTNTYFNIVECKICGLNLKIFSALEKFI